MYTHSTHIHIYTGVSTNALEWTYCLDLGGHHLEYSMKLQNQ